MINLILTIINIKNGFVCFLNNFSIEVFLKAHYLTEKRANGKRKGWS